MLALAIPLAVAALGTARLSLVQPLGRVGFAMVLAMLLYSFGENLEMLAYLYWPALVLIGVAARHAVVQRLA